MKKKIRLIAGAVALAISTLGGVIAFNVSNKNEASLNATEGTYWSGITTDGTVYGNAFRQALITKMKTATVTGSYAGCKTVLCSSDLDPAGSGKMLGFYDEAKLTPEWDSAATWNREHVWPDSRGAGQSGPGGDPHMIRPAAVSTNGSRGNNMYAASGSGTFDPGNSIAKYRGIAARIIFYTATRWWTDPGLNSNNLELTENTGDTASNNTMGKLSDLLAWNDQYPVDATETHRNEYLYGQNYCRNPFIDHPEWAHYIWDVNAGSSNKYIRQSAYTPTSTSSSSAASSSSAGSTSSSQSSSSSSSSTATSGGTYQLVKSTSDLTAGSKYLIASASSGTAQFISTSIIGTYYQGIVANAINSDSTVTPSSSTEVFTLGGSTGAWTFTTSVRTANSGLLCVSGTYNNLTTVASPTATDFSTWTISIDSSSYAATVKNVGAASDHYMEYYSSKNEFNTYSTASTVYLFKEVSSGSKTVNSLERSGTPSTTTYTAGQSFDPTGLTITASYSDGTSADVTSLMTWTPSPLTAGTTSVTGTYQGLTVTITGLTVNVAAVTLSSISVTTEPTKGTYTVGDTLDTTGLVITATYSDDSTQVISSGYTLSPANGSVLSTAGSQTITVTYSGKTTTFSVTVNAASVGGTKTITAASTNMPTSYPSGKSVSLEGIQMTLTNIGTFDGKKTIQFKSTKSSKMYNTSDDGTITSIVISGSEAVDLTVYCGSSSNPTATTISPTVSGTTYTYTFPAGMDYFSIVGSSSSTINVTSIAINYAASGDGATTFATAFLSALSTVCTDGQNNSTPSSALVTAWANEYTAWQALASADQTTLTSATANVSGTSIQQAVARYDYILSKYGTSAFDSGNYMGRTIASSGAKANVLAKDDTGLILLASTLIMASLACGFYFLRKKRA